MPTRGGGPAPPIKVTHSSVEWGPILWSRIQQNSFCFKLDVVTVSEALVKSIRILSARSIVLTHPRTLRASGHTRALSDDSVGFSGPLLPTGSPRVLLCPTLG